MRMLPYSHRLPTLSAAQRARHSRRASRDGRRAFTLIEIMIAISVFALLGAAATTFLIKQTRAVTRTAGYLDAQQNASFAMGELDHDLRVAGGGLGQRQPMVIEAHPFAVSFNADLVSHDTSTTSTAAYYDPSAPDSLSLAVTPANKFAFPYSAVLYPDSQYMQSPGVVSNAETITYWVTLDSTTARPDDYLLLRRVNNAAPTLVARGLVYPAGAPAFRYFIRDTVVNSRKELTAPTLPLYFKEGTLGPDTMLAKISEVRVQLNVVYRDPLGKDGFRSVNEYVPLLNAGLAHVAACPSPPAAPASITATAAPTGDSIDVAWPASTDETGGKKDVKSYSVYRRKGTTGPWNEPIYTTPADGVASYVWHNKAVPLLKLFEYAVVAVDCTPGLSSLTIVGGTVSANP